MSLFNKILSSVLAFGFVVFVSSDSFAAEDKVTNTEKTTKEQETSKADGILFRIENIEPLKNKDDLIDRCKFLVTVYNRTSKEIKEATLNFEWTDNIAAKYKIEGDKVVAENDAEKVKTVITKTITISSVLPHKQKSFEETIETDKCFWLLDQLQYKVESCYAEGDNVTMKNSKLTGQGTCGGLFDYINSKNPEYYSEFKDVPDSVIEKQAEEEKNQELTEINNGYGVTIKNLDETIDVLQQIQ